jgi:hypothetical protein
MEFSATPSSITRFAPPADGGRFPVVEGFDERALCALARGARARAAATSRDPIRVRGIVRRML